MQNPKCGAADKMESYRLRDKIAQIVSFTGDMLAAALDPPNIYGQIEFEGGGRNTFDFTDCTVEELSTGKSMGMSFRRKYHDKIRDIIGYVWKAVPLKEVI